MLENEYAKLIFEYQRKKIGNKQNENAIGECFTVKLRPMNPWWWLRMYKQNDRQWVKISTQNCKEEF